MHRHPSEIDLSLDQMADIAYVAREIEKADADNASAILKALMGSRF